MLKICQYKIPQPYKQVLQDLYGHTFLGEELYKGLSNWEGMKILKHQIYCGDYKNDYATCFTNMILDKTRDGIVNILIENKDNNVRYNLVIRNAISSDKKLTKKSLIKVTRIDCRTTDDILPFLVVYEDRNNNDRICYRNETYNFTELDDINTDITNKINFKSSLSA